MCISTDLVKYPGMHTDAYWWCLELVARTAVTYRSTCSAAPSHCRPRAPTPVPGEHRVVHRVVQLRWTLTQGARSTWTGLRPCQVCTWPKVTEAQRGQRLEELLRLLSS